MNYKLLLLTVFTSCFISLKAQDIKFCFQTGYGFYNMSSLKRNTRYLPFDTKTVSNYPAYQYYKPMIKLVTRNFEFGVVYLFQTTGSRISSKDYSGEYRYDTKINSNSPGVIINKTFHNWGNIKAGLYLVDQIPDLYCIIIDEIK